MLTKPPDQVLPEIGKFFLGYPYAVATLEKKSKEHLVVNLREHDCVTFIENVLALSWCIGSRDKSFKTFRRILQKIRYRGGLPGGYCSRLHYFSDWIYENEKRGILKDITAEIGGRPLRKALHYMTAHVHLYPPLKEPADFRRMRSVERRISRRLFFFIPKEVTKHIENRIHEGDLIALTTHREGLDIHHVGLASGVKNRIHLLHASQKEGKVVLSRKTLYGYLMGNCGCTGIMVARPVNANPGFYQH